MIWAIWIPSLQITILKKLLLRLKKMKGQLLTKILQQLSDKDVNIKITPDALDIISGAVQTTNVMGVPLIDVHSGCFQAGKKISNGLLISLHAATGLLCFHRF